MKKSFLLVILIVFSVNSFAQLAQKLSDAMQDYLRDEQFAHALNGFYVVETKTGKPVYDLNSQIGFAPASSQKILTAIAGFEILGSEYKYATSVYYANGNLILKGSGDPTLGSWRFIQTKREKNLDEIIRALQRNGVKKIEGDLILDNSACSYQPLPGGWIWEDIGNYYGAGSWAINWNENQYDLHLKPGVKEGDRVEISGITPEVAINLKNNLLTGKPGSGDNGYIYLAPNSTNGWVEGTVPPVKTFTISGSIPNPALQMGKELKKVLQQHNISFSGKIIDSFYPVNMDESNKILTLFSPAFDSICYWFLQKSINLYGEAIAKTIAINKKNSGSTENGVSEIIAFWKQNGIDANALRIVDGSGLSPLNRVTPAALVAALQFAKKKNWYPEFLHAMPTFNGIKMKSGTIGGSKAFAGYITSANGTGYTFAIISNNFSGSSAQVVQKMYKVLNVLKK